MGCCASRPRGEQREQQPVPANAATAATSSFPLTPPALRDPSRPASSTNSAASSTSVSPPVRLDQHFNAPLRPHAWRTKAARKPWTRAKWLRMREEFFDTRVTNRAEVWGSLKAVVELLDQGDVSTAQGILDASDITLPTGNLVDGAYDSLGNLYQLPHYVVSAPSNVIEDGDEHVQKDVDTLADAEDQGLQPFAPTQSEKGKEVATTGEMIEVKARLSDRGGLGQDVTVTIGKSDSTKILINAVAAQAGVPKDKVRIAYMGKILKPKLGFVAQGWQTGHIVNALITP